MAEWWEFKIVPIASVFYATAALTARPLHELWWSLLILLAALVPGAVYVSTINDFTDRDDDRAAGKPVRDVPVPLVAAIVSVCVGAGLAVGWMWRGDRALVLSYAAAWLAFSLYSLPPFRFKTRGMLGVVCDAAGSLMCPALVAVFLAYRAAGISDPDWRWVGAVAVWALAYGLRGILWHQLHDADADRRTGLRTLVAVHGIERTRRLGTWVVFPVEVLALAVLVVQLPQMWPVVAAFVAYVFLASARVRRWRLTPVIAAPAPGPFFIVLLEFYDVFFPLALLATATAVHSGDGAVLAAHCLVFPVQISEAVRSAWRLTSIRALAGRVSRAVKRVRALRPGS